MGISIDFVGDVKLIKLANKIELVSKKLSRLDFFLGNSRIENVIYKEFENNFASGGSPKKFKKLTPTYAKLKKKLFGVKPILTATGKLRRSLTGGGELFKTKKMLRIRSKVGYGLSHLTGVPTTKLPTRKPVQLKRGASRRVISLMVSNAIKDVKKL